MSVNTNHCCLHQLEGRLSRYRLVNPIISMNQERARHSVETGIACALFLFKHPERELSSCLPWMLFMPQYN